MSWIIVRQGFFRYLKDRDPLEAYSRDQRDAIRFPTRRKAKAALGWSACIHSSWTCRVVKLTPRSARLEKEVEVLSNWVLRLSQMPLDWTSQETQRQAKRVWQRISAGPRPSNGEEPNG